MDYYWLNVALDIFLEIFIKSKNLIKELKASYHINEISESDCTLYCFLRTEKQPHAFCQIHISINELALDHKVNFQIMGIIDEIEFSGTIFNHMFIETIMDEYYDLKPLITEGIKHFIDEREEKQRRAIRTFEVRYKIHDDFYEGDEDYVYAYDIDQIAESSLPYIQSLYKIHSTLFDQYINK